MNFFEAQREARRDSVYLIFLFVLVCALSAFGVGWVASFFIEHNLSAASDARRMGFLFFSSLFWPVSLGVFLVIALTSLFKYLTLGSGRNMAALLGARQVSVHTALPAERKLLNVVEEIAIAAGSPVPAIFVVWGDHSINAFAAGTDAESAVIGVTQGTLESLDREELQGVVAHEMSHIIFADILINQRIAAAVFGLFVITRIGQELLRGGTRSSRRDKGGAAPVALAFFVVGALGWFFGRILQAAISRKREELADAASAQFTRNPESLARALVKSENRVENFLAEKGMEFHHMYFSSVTRRMMLASLFSTHPLIADRVQSLLPHLKGERLEKWMKETAAGARAPQALRKSNAPAAEPLGGAQGLGRLAATMTGTLARVNLEAAHAHLGALQNTLRDVFEREGGFEKILRSLLRLSSEKAPTDALDEKLKILLAQKPENFLTILQLTTFGLREAPNETRELLLKEVQRAVLEDGRLFPKEVLLAAFCRFYLSSARPKANAEAATVHWISFLSALTPDGKWARTPQSTELARQALSSLRILRPADDTANMETLLHGLMALSKTNLIYKEKLVAALWTCLSGDGGHSTEESELIRGVCILLSVPTPPFLAKGAASV